MSVTSDGCRAETAVRMRCRSISRSKFWFFPARSRGLASMNSTFFVGLVLTEHQYGCWDAVP